MGADFEVFSVYLDSWFDYQHVHSLIVKDVFQMNGMTFTTSFNG